MHMSCNYASSSFIKCNTKKIFNLPISFDFLLELSLQQILQLLKRKKKNRERMKVRLVFGYTLSLIQVFCFFLQRSKSSNTLKEVFVNSLMEKIVSSTKIHDFTRTHPQVATHSPPTIFESKPPTIFKLQSPFSHTRIHQNNQFRDNLLKVIIHNPQTHTRAHTHTHRGDIVHI